MPLDVEIGLLGIELRFGTNPVEEISPICHIHTCAAMSTGNLTVRKWRMLKYPRFVVTYIQFDDLRPREPLQLHYAVEDLVNTESIYIKLTDVLRYWIQYTQDGKHGILTFRLGNTVTVNSLIKIQTIKAWISLLDNEKSLNYMGHHGLPP